MYAYAVRDLNEQFCVYFFSAFLV